MNLHSSKISLYVHIPFCLQKCHYCDFYSEVNKLERIPSVISNIIDQLNHNYAEYGSPEIETIFIGGGTPSFIPLMELERLFIAIKALAPKPIEFTIESNPESITKGFLELCQKYGVTRLSIGIQSINEKMLKILGRYGSKSTVDKALNLVKEYWSGDFSMDFISSIPYQTTKMVEEDILYALDAKPDHISFYALALEEGTPLEDSVSKGFINELTECETENIWLYGRDILIKNGFNNYEVSNYTKCKPCLHNISYWELKPYLGVGPGAVSTLINNSGDIVRVSTKKSIATFLEGEKSKWGEVLEVIEPKDFFEDYIMMGLRLKNGINRDRFKSIFNIDIFKAIPISNKLIEEGLLIESKNFFTLTDYGFDTMNSVIVRILESLDPIAIEKVNWFF